MFLHQMRTGFGNATGNILQISMKVVLADIRGGPS
jgi:hypothetical protein